jgi:DNA polymerase-3 subunit delta'
MWQVKGQEKAINLIDQALKNGLIAHSYLLTGPEHIGKMTLAKNMAQALNCEQSSPPCGECRSCLKIANSSHADVTIVSLSQEDDSEKTEIGIDRIRDICHSANMLPYEGKFRVFIIDKAELLSPAASNALLKTIEEPPPQIVFIFLTSDSSRLLPTIVSRCQVISLKLVPISQVEQFLTQTYKISPERSRLLAWLSRGRIGWAISAAEDESTIIKHQEGVKKLVDIINDNEEERLEAAADMAARFAKNRESVYSMLNDWLNFLRDLLLTGLGLSELVINVDFKSVLDSLSPKIEFSDLIESISETDRASVDLRHNVSPRLVLDNLFLDLPKRMVEV